MGTNSVSLCLIILAVLPVGSPAARADSTGLIFYAGFEGEADLKAGYVVSADADVAAGEGAGEALDGELKFEPGKRGNALLAGDGCARVRYAAEKNIRPQQGTAEFWICSKDWEIDHGKYHVLFEASGPDGNILRYFKIVNKSYTHLWTGKTGTDARGKNRFSNTELYVGFRPERWMHLALTWSPEKICIYVNGERGNVCVNPKLPAELTQFIVGDWPLGDPHGGHTLIDELYIYGRALNEREVAWIYGQAATREKGRGLPKVIGAPEAALTCFPSRREIRVSVNTGSSLSGLTGVATLDPAPGAQPATLAETGHQKCEGVLQYESLAPGRYVVRVALEVPSGDEIRKCEKSLVVPDASLWLGNSIGISSRPPSPFAPVKVRRKLFGGTSISCWGRTYRLGALALPEEIETRGEQILASPVKLLAAAGGRDAHWDEGPVRMEKRSAVKAILSGSAAAGLGKLHWRCTAEYDGMLRYDLAFEPVENTALDCLEIRFPLRRSNARLIWTRERRGLLPDGQGVLVEQPWSPYIWLGDEDRGVAIFCESESAWQEVDGEPGFLLERRDGVVEIVYRFANAGTPWRLKKPWKFTFGIEATPVKDASRWRRFRPAGLAVTPPGYHNVWIKHDGAKPPGIGQGKYFGYAEPSVPLEEYRRHVASLKAKGPHESGPCLVLQYLLPSCLSGRSPEAFFGAEWRASPYPHGQWAGEGSIYGTMLLIAPTPAWRDFVVWKMDRFMDETGIDGVYADFSILNVGNNTLTGFPHDVRDGKARNFWPFFATRELFKRIYTMHKQRGEDTFFFGHLANLMYVPFAAFLDGGLDGEHLNSELSKDYRELLPLDLIQVQYAGKNLGVNTYFLPLKVPSEKRKNWESASKPYMISMALLHDYGLYWGSFERRPTLEAAYEFGILDSEFIPYWRNSHLVGGQGDAIKCSIYHKQRGGALIVISNLTRQVQNPTLDVDWRRLASRGPLQVVDALSGKPVSVDGNAVTMKVSPLACRLLCVK